MDAVEIRQQRTADSAVVRAVITAAFTDDGHVADLSEALTRRRDPGASLVAEVGGEIVGHVQLSRSWVDAPDRLVDVLVLSPLSVLPARRRRGVGRALVAAAQGQANTLGSPVLFLEGDPAYYSRLGFEVGARHGFTAPSVRIPPPAFQVALLDGYEPSITGALVYNDTFWAHDAVGLR